jgi:hypothetical protein
VARLQVGNNTAKCDFMYVPSICADPSPGKFAPRVGSVSAESRSCGAAHLTTSGVEGRVSRTLGCGLQGQTHNLVSGTLLRLNV